MLLKGEAARLRGEIIRRSLAWRLQAGRELLCFPMHPSLDDADFKGVTMSIRDFFNG